jgi:hypothetical protein
MIVLRHSSSGACHLLSRICRSAIINAGDGMHEHPTQALLDAFTIRDRKKTLLGLRYMEPQPQKRQEGGHDDCRALPRSERRTSRRGSRRGRATDGGRGFRIAFEARVFGISGHGLPPEMCDSAW